MNQTALIRIGIVADDLTSATDGAAPFLPKGYGPLITQCGVEPWQSALVAIDTKQPRLNRNADSDSSGLRNLGHARSFHYHPP